MPIIEVGIDFSAAEKESEEARKPVPEGDYRVQVIDVTIEEAGESSKNPGRPYLNFVLEIVDNTKFSGKKLFYSAMLPFRDSSNNLNTKGVGFLVDITKALGRPWQGGQLQTEQYIGLSCYARVGVQPRRDDPSKAQNQVKGVF